MAPPTVLAAAPRRYRAVVLPLGFKFDLDTVLVHGIAHRSDRAHLPRPLRPDAVSVGAAGIYQAERCPRECPHCRPPFETLLSYQLEPLAAAPASDRAAR
jgi:hypothetical protein